MKNLTPALVKIAAFVIPVLGAIILAAIVTFFLGLWGRTPNTPAPSETLATTINNLRGTTTPTPPTVLKIGLPYGYKGAPQTYAAKTENVAVKADFANPSTNENVTRNIEVRVYKFIKIISPLSPLSPLLDLSKGSVFDEATLGKVFNKELGTYELDLYPVFSKEFKGQVFTPSETKTIAVDFTPAESGYYAVILAESDYFASNTGGKAVGFIRVTNSTSPTALTTPTTKGGQPIVTETATTSALPATGGAASLLTVLAGAFAALGLKLRKLIKK